MKKNILVLVVVVFWMTVLMGCSNNEADSGKDNFEGDEAEGMAEVSVDHDDTQKDSDSDSESLYMEPGLAEQIDIKIYPLLNKSVLFELTNVGSETIVELILTLNFFEEGEEEVIERETYFKAIGPGKTTYNFTSLKEFDIDLERTEWGFTYNAYGFNYADAVDQISLEYHENEDYTIGAVVVNEGSQALELVKVLAIFYIDSEIVGATERFTTELEPGEEGFLEFLRPYDEDLRMVVADEVVLKVSHAYYKEDSGTE